MGIYHVAEIILWAQIGVLVGVAGIAVGYVISRIRDAHHQNGRLIPN